MPMTETEYSSFLGNNCRVLLFDSGTAEIVRQQNPVTQKPEQAESFWTGYFYGRAVEIQSLPLPTTVTV